MAKNLYNLTAVTTVNDSDLLHVNQGSVSSDYKVTKANLLKEVNSAISTINNSLTTLSNKFTYRDYSVTTGTTLYSAYYYGGVNVDTSLGAIVGVVILSTTSNQAAFASIVSSTGVRVFSPISGLTAGVRVLFMAS